MALAVHGWPGPLPGWDGGLLVISTVNFAGDGREAARARIRAAVCEALAASLGLDAVQVTVESIAGSAPRLLVNGAASAMGISISHAGAMSVAAISGAGAVGVDLMEVHDISDWARVAHDYLGMATACRLAAAVPADRPRAFAQAWAEREAHLKLLGQPLAEWTPAPGECRLHGLALPAGLVGAVAVQRWCQV
jgi:4'-phosphopantetheinyl transferase